MNNLRNFTQSGFSYWLEYNKDNVTILISAEWKLINFIFPINILYWFNNDDVILSGHSCKICSQVPRVYQEDLICKW